ncbi:hypothetical protein ABZ128_26475 [Streptomyces sp. NPDC006326]|uniref:hypothetical protein n=1 Tax=Streptomyces sp. NPDC006326 TaxID=3156752 RepID=UPI0033B1EE69
MHGTHRTQGAYRRNTVGAVLAAVLLAAGTTGCEDGGKSGAGAAQKPSGSPAAPQAAPAPAEAVTAAYRKFQEAKSAKVRMTISMPASVGGGGTVEMTGVQGWNPQAMDITMKSSGTLAQRAGGADSIRMIMLNNAMYMDMGAEKAAQRDGKRWMKLDLTAAAAASGDPAAGRKLGGMQNMNQDPAQQLALLTDSPGLKHLGAEKVDGVETEHYKGALSVEEMLAANKKSQLMDPKEREQFVEKAKRAGIKGYDTELWIDKAGYPVRMAVGIASPEGTMTVDARYSDYGAAANVTPPADEETLDLFKELAALGADTGGDA